MSVSHAKINQSTPKQIHSNVQLNSIDHPEMFDEDEDLAIPRYQFVNGKTKRPIFKRPFQDGFLCPPKIKLAQMKRSCEFCTDVFSDHKKHHHIIHESCQI